MNETAPGPSLGLPMESTMHREPPYNAEAEQGLLAAILVNNRAYERVVDFLQPEHFADPAHGRIYAEIARLIDQGRQAAPHTLKGIFDQDDALHDVGGAQYLVKLAASVVTVINAGDYGRVIFECWRRRQLIEAGETLVNNAFDWSLDDVDAIMSAAQSDIDDVASIGAGKKELNPVSVGLDEALRRAEIVLREGPDAGGMSTGISDLDRAMGRLMPGRLYVIGARPKMGKSALAVRLARNLAAAGHPVAFFSLEMPEDEIAARLLAAESGVSQEAQESGDFDQAGFQKLYAAREEIGAWPIYIDDTPAAQVREIRRRAMRLRRQHGLSAVFVDYLQLIAPGNNRQNRNNNRTNDLTEITGALKALAKELSVPVIALSQLSRALESREDKRPKMSDLRESGSIEQDADVVLFPYRPEYYLEKEEPVFRAGEGDAKFIERQSEWERAMEKGRNVMEAIVGARRSGKAGHARLYANMATGVITNGEF